MISYKQELKEARWYTLPTRILVDTDGNFIQTETISGWVKNNPMKFFRCATEDEQTAFYRQNLLGKNIKDIKPEGKRL